MPTRGELTEAAALKELTRLGLLVSVPFAGDAPYDLVVDLRDGRFVRVQCKSGRWKDGCVIFNSASTDHGRGHLDYHGRADVFAVYCPPIDRVFVVPVEEAASRATRLRLDPCRNGQQLGVRRAADHTPEAWLANILARPWTSPSSSSAPPAPSPRPAVGCPPRWSGAGASGSSSTAARAPSGS